MISSLWLKKISSSSYERFTEAQLRKEHDVVAFVGTIMIAWFLTGSVAVATTIGVADSIVKTLLFYGHERAWDVSDWGRG